MNDDIDFSAASPCELGHVFEDVCRWILYLRQRHGVVAHVMLCRIDVKDAFRQIVVDPLHAAKFEVTFLTSTLSWTCSCNLDGVAALIFEIL